MMEEHWSTKFDYHANSLNAIERSIKFYIDKNAENGEIVMTYRCLIGFMYDAICHLDAQNRILCRRIEELELES